MTAETLPAALKRYRAAVRAAAWQEEHGTHGDGMAAEAARIEAAALRHVHETIRAAETGRR